MSPRDGMAIAKARIAEEAERRTGALDRRDLGLPELPEALFTLRHLRVLDLGTSEPWREDPPRSRLYNQRLWLASLDMLETLSLSGSDVTKLDFVQHLTALQQLD